MLQRGECIALCLLATACGSSRGSAPPDAPAGDLASASRLVLTMSAFANADGTSDVQVCLDPEGICVPECDPSDLDCHSYPDLEVELNGVALPQVNAGGARSCGDAVGCTYPVFGSPTLVGGLSNAGTQVLSVRIAGQSTQLTIPNWATGCSLSPGALTLTSGARTRMTVEPAGIFSRGEVGIAFGYDQQDIEDQWGIDRGYASGTDVEDTGVVVEPADWVDGGFDFRVPVNMPSGTGTLTVDEAQQPSAASCPFASCRFRGGAQCSVAARVVQPAFCPSTQTLCCQFTTCSCADHCQAPSDDADAENAVLTCGESDAGCDAPGAAAAAAAFRPARWSTAGAEVAPDDCHAQSVASQKESGAKPLGLAPLALSIMLCAQFTVGR